MKPPRNPQKNAPGPRRPAPVIIAIALMAVAAAAALAWRAHLASEWNAPGGSKPAARGDYAGSAACASCHSRETEAWRGSHHGVAMQEASAATVLGDFGGTTFAAPGDTTRFVTHDGRYFAIAAGADGRPAEF